MRGANPRECAKQSFIRIAGLKRMPFEANRATEPAVTLYGFRGAMQADVTCDPKGKG
jgi:hypothetical protein